MVQRKRPSMEDAPVTMLNGTSSAVHQLVRQGSDPHALTCNGVRYHGGGGVTHGDARQRLRH